jgi:hypothetical protein
MSERVIGFGIVAGLVVSQANTALFDDLVHRQASFGAVGWGNWFLYLLVPIVGGGVLLYYGRVRPAVSDRAPERAFFASVVALVAATAALRIAVPAILHAGEVIPARVPRTLADGFSFVGQYARLVPLAGVGGGYDVATAAVAVGIVCAAMAFGALAFELRPMPILASALVGAAWTLVGWYVPGGAGLRIIGSLWPMFVLGSVGLALGIFETRGNRGR